MTEFNWADLACQAEVEERIVDLVATQVEKIQDLVLYSADELFFTLKQQVPVDKIERLLDVASRMLFPLEESLAVHSPSSRLSTLDPELDEYFGGGGIPSKAIVEVSGVAGSGKSNFALQLAISATLASPSAGVLYICTEGNFPFQRLFDIFTARFPQIPLEQIQQQYCSRIWVQHFAEYQVLEHFIAHQLTVCIEKYSAVLLIIDSVVCNVRAEENRPQITASYLQMAERLTKIAVERNLFTILINQVTAFVEEEGNVNFNWRASLEHLPILTRTVPALGLSWANCMNLRLFFWRAEAEHFSLRQRKPVLLSGTGCKKEHCNFYLSHTGISCNPCSE